MTGYLFHTEADRRDMLAAIGASSVQQIIDEQVPAEVQLRRPLQLGPGLSEMALEVSIGALAERNASAASHVCFLGGGAYDHFIPAAVDELASRGEFYTSYTPYQAEVSQGNLQAMFEYETLVTQLTGLGVSNASLYDGGSAMVEAVLMALSASDRQRVVIGDTVHPHYRAALDTYLSEIEAQGATVRSSCGTVAAELAAAIDDQTACVVIQHPNFFGRLEDVAQVVAAARAAGALVIQVFDPVSVGLLRRPGDLGVDIAVAEGQSLGNPLNFGGPYLGIMACREDLVRRLPGRIAGQTTDRRGQRCWVLTLQTREQHIRREKATSNICSNQTLLALRAAIHLSLLGPQGLRETAELCARKAWYAKSLLARSERLEVVHDGPMFKEFVIRDRERRVDELLEETLSQGILAGVPLRRWYPELDDCLLVAVTEKRTRQQIEQLAELLSPSMASV